MTTNVVPKLLVAIYLLLGAYVLLQIVLLIKQKHKPLSYKAIFSWFSLAWMTLRALFWVLVVAGVTIPSAIFYILFWLPHSIIYMTFATLALFLTKVVARTSWSGVFRRRMMILYGAFGSIDTIGTVTISIMANASNSNNMQNIELAGTGVLFLLLSGVYVYVLPKTRTHKPRMRATGRARVHVRAVARALWGCAGTWAFACVSCKCGISAACSCSSRAPFLVSPLHLPSCLARGASGTL
ncbi:hypothetical protein EON67_02240 [archaeon]|nr:MAG: hypothetical protein EON67_02240 [archaeon]